MTIERKKSELGSLTPFNESLELSPEDRKWLETPAMGREWPICEAELLKGLDVKTAHADELANPFGKELERTRQSDNE